MLNELSGKFFHIDFGHFLNHFKTKLGFNRDREYFIFSREMYYLMVNYRRLYKDFKPDEQQNIQKVVARKFLNQASGFTATGSIPKHSSNADISSRNSKEKAQPRDQLPRVSQRKLFRVKKWKDVPKDKFQKIHYKKMGIEQTE